MPSSEAKDFNYIADPQAFTFGEKETIRRHSVALSAQGGRPHLGGYLVAGEITSSALPLTPG